MSWFKFGLVVFCLLKSPMAVGGQVSGVLTLPGAPHAGNAVVYIDKIPGATFEPPTEPVVINQESLTFQPHVVPVLIGTTVSFINSDPVLHNVFSPDECLPGFDLGTWPKGVVSTYTFNQTCEAVLLCNVHPEMEAFVLVLETPYFAVTAKDGTYQIDDIPAGQYTLKVWHERRQGESRALDLTADAERTIDFTLLP